MTQNDTSKFIMRMTRKAARTSGNGDPVFLTKFASQDAGESLNDQQKDDLRTALMYNVSELIGRIDDERVRELSKSGFTVLSRDEFNSLMSEIVKLSQETNSDYQK